MGGEVRYLNVILGREHSLYEDPGAGKGGLLTASGMVWKCRGLGREGVGKQPGQEGGGASPQEGQVS